MIGGNDRNSAIPWAESFFSCSFLDFLTINSSRIGVSSRTTLSTTKKIRFQVISLVCLLSKSNGINGRRCSVRSMSSFHHPVSLARMAIRCSRGHAHSISSVGLSSVCPLRRASIVAACAITQAVVFPSPTPDPIMRGAMTG